MSRFRARAAGRLSTWTRPPGFSRLSQGLLNLRQTIPAGFILGIRSHRLLRMHQGLFGFLLFHKHGGQSQVRLGKVGVVVDRLTEVFLGFDCLSRSAVELAKLIGCVCVAWER